MSNSSLVLIHGRAQEHKDAVALKCEWLEALRAGLAKSGLALPLSEGDIKFPYYGQTLYDLVSDAGPWPRWWCAVVQARLMQSNGFSRLCWRR